MSVQLHKQGLQAACALDHLPTEVLNVVGDHLAGGLEVAGVCGPSVLVRDIAQLAAVSKSVAPIVQRAWAALGQQLSDALFQMEIGDLLDEAYKMEPFDVTRAFGPVDSQNSATHLAKLHSSGLQALQYPEKLLLCRALKAPDGPLQPRRPLAVPLKQARAPAVVRLTVASEKCHWCWYTPSPLWTDSTIGGTKQLETIDILRELLSSRLDRGLAPDMSILNLLEAHNLQPPYGHCGMNTWWGVRKLVCDRWTPADLVLKQRARRMAASICLHCMDVASKHCAMHVCKSCCQQLHNPCFVHNPPASPSSSHCHAKRLRRRSLM